MKKDDLLQKGRRTSNALGGKIWKIMRLTGLFLLISFVAISAETYSQNTRFSFKMENRTLNDLFLYLEQNSGYRFAYNKSDLDDAQKISCEFKNESVDQILEKVLDTGKLSVSIKNEYIIITSKENARGNLLLVNQPIKTVSGRVSDSSGAPLPGVSVVVKGTTTGVITDVDGKFTLTKVPEDAALVFSFVGMKAQEIPVKGKTIINVTLVEEAVGIEEVVAVGYGTQRKGNVTGSISTVKSKELTITPIASSSNSLSGRLPGLISLQSSGQPGADAATLSIRGFGTALIIVDGVEADFNSIDPNQIESISILKDGLASVYGARAGNGVILVTTKRGGEGKPVITMNSSYTLQGITTMPHPVNAGQYAELSRESWLQSGQPEQLAPFTTDQIKKYYQGTDPQYPNTNWYKVLVRDWAPQQQHNFSVRGGSEKIKYYGFLGYLDQETMWKKSGGNYNRYNLQSNLDAKILDNLMLKIDIASTIEARKYPWRPMNSDVWQDFWNTLPIYPSSLPDPTKISYAFGAGTGGAHVTTNRNTSGYNDTNSQNIKGTITLDYSFKSIKGLSAKGFVNYSQDYSTNKMFRKPVKFYTYDNKSDIYTLAGALGGQAQLDMNKAQSRVITSQLSLRYENTFGKNHKVNGLLLYEIIDYYGDWISAARNSYLTDAIDQLFAGSTNGMSNDGSASEMGRASYVGRIDYSFKDKYLIETIFRADASAKFPNNSRWGYFPSISVGWRLSEENFMKKFEAIDDLKLRTSYGESGNDNIGNFQYLSGYVFGGYPYLLNDASHKGLVSRGLSNPHLTWEKIQTYNVGLDFSLFNKKINGEGDVFYRKRIGILATRLTSLPSSFGASLPLENINSSNDRGFELKLGTIGKYRDLSWNLSGNVSWSRAKWDHFEEPEYTDKDQKRISQKSEQWTDRSFGYLSNGLFTSQEEINALTFDQDQKQNQSLRPGDIKYVDTNNDGVLDWRDQVEIGKGTVPHWFVGFNTNLQFRNFDLSALFQGAFGFSQYLNFMRGNNYPDFVFNERWTETNNRSNAIVPRLGSSATNEYYSDFRYKKAGYLRLKVFSIGYTIPSTWLKRMNVNQTRLYISGTNLLTFDKLKKYNVDPEAPSGSTGAYYPQQKTISVGISLSL